MKSMSMATSGSRTARVRECHATMLASRIRSLKRQASTQSGTEGDPTAKRPASSNFLRHVLLGESSQQSAGWAFETAGWWSEIMMNATALRWDRLHLKGPLRPLHLASGCTGIGSEFLACRICKIPVFKDAVASESKSHASSVLLANTPEVAHVFRSLGDHALGEGFCLRHGRTCSIPQIHQANRDLLVMGSPCQPFTSLHASRGCRKHPLFSTTFGRDGDDSDSALGLVRALLPGAVLLEQVEGFAHFDMEWQKTPLDEFSRLMFEVKNEAGAPHFTAARVFRLNANLWVDMNRPRCLVAMPVMCVIHSHCTLFLLHVLERTDARDDAVACATGGGGLSRHDRFPTSPWIQPCG